MNEVGADLAAKVLAANTRNVVKKVGEGGTLTAGQAAQLQLETLPSTSAAELRSARTAALLLRWASAGRLTDEEKEEIDHLLPPAPHLVGHLTRASYKHSIEKYAADLGWKSAKTLKRWIEKGRACDPPDLPPFDEPEQLAAWWARVMENKVPDRLLQLASGQASSQSAPLLSPPPTDSAPPPSSSNRGPVTLPSGSGFGAAFERAQENERYASWELAEARKNPNDAGRIKMAQQAWEKAFDALRKSSKDAEQVMLSSGDMVLWSEVEKEQAECLQVLNQSLRSLLTRVATKVPLPGDLFHRFSRAYQDELDKLFNKLADEDYAPAFALDAA